MWLRSMAGKCTNPRYRSILSILLSFWLLRIIPTLRAVSGQALQNWYESPPDGYHVKRLRFAGNFTDEYFSCMNNASIVTANGQNGVTYTELHLTNSNSTPEYGTCVYKDPLSIVKNNPKYPKLKYITSFRSVIQFYAADRGTGQGEGMTFMIVPSPTGQSNSSGGLLGLLSGAPPPPGSASSFAGEIDTRQQVEFSDPAYHHVGIDITSLQSLSYSSLSHNQSDGSDRPSITPGTLYSAWMSWDSGQGLAEINVEETAKSGDSPELEFKSESSLLKFSISILDSVNFYYNGPEMYVGFSSSTSESATNSFRITFWMFEYLEENPPPVVEVIPHRNKAWLVIAIIICCTLFSLFLLCICIGLWRRRYLQEAKAAASACSKDNGSSGRISLKELESLEIGPRRFTYKELSAATRGFSSKEVLGKGGFGCVYKGVLRGKGTEVAVKRISETSRQGPREFLAEVKIIGRLRHKNLVQLLGWCFERGELLLVYEYMPNGSLDQALFPEKDAPVLSWEQRVKIITGMATALQYLHEDWEQRVVHRDVKSSNVMLDISLNARLGDFGLARLYAHSQAPQSTATAGTLGYLAPELLHSSKATDKSDIFSFGVVALETATAKRPLTLSLDGVGMTSEVLVLVDWVWSLYSKDKLVEAADPRLGGRFNETQLKMVLQLGLSCCHPDPTARPCMRQVLQILAFETPLPPLPRSKPVPTFRRHDERPLVPEEAGKGEHAVSVDVASC